MKRNNYIMVMKAVRSDDSLTECQKNVILLVAMNPDAVKRKPNKNNLHVNGQHIVGAKVDDDTWSKTVAIRRKRGNIISKIIRPDIKKCINRWLKQNKTATKKG